jgi:NAD(P)-dependent dehydrogenase (short-subunit alcohol dehydrogenase family)
MERFRDRVAVVTGAASGIGLALAERFAAEGMKVVMADVETAALEAAAAKVRAAAPAVLAVPTDVSRAEDVDRLARETYAVFGAAHIVCNNAGVAVIGAVHEQTLADWQWVLGVNLWGVIHGVHAFLPRMLGGGDEGHFREHGVDGRPHDRAVHVDLRRDQARRRGAVGVAVQGAGTVRRADRRLGRVSRAHQYQHHAVGTQPAARTG